jgi:excisionase family DNA binding protein
MDKKETAEMLDVSTRLVEKYASQGWLGQVRYIRGKTGKRADYEPEAVERLKLELESPDTAIATRSPDARLFVASLVEALASREQQHSASVRTSEKLFLTKEEARQLSGLPMRELDEAIKAGTLRVKRVGRSDKIKRTDLDEFIKNY